jgi:hypothetical protein
MTELERLERKLEHELDELGALGALDASDPALSAGLIDRVKRAVVAEDERARRRWRLAPGVRGFGAVAAAILIVLGISRTTPMVVSPAVDVAADVAQLSEWNEAIEASTEQITAAVADATSPLHSDTDDDADWIEWLFGLDEAPQGGA